MLKIFELLGNLNGSTQLIVLDEKRGNIKGVDVAEKLIIVKICPCYGKKIYI